MALMYLVIGFIGLIGSVIAKDELSHRAGQKVTKPRIATEPKTP